MGLLEVKFGTQEIGWGRRGWQQIGAFHEALWMFMVDIQYWLDTWNPNLGVLVLENDFLNLDMAMNMASRLHRYKRGWTFLTPLRKQDFSTLINWGRIGESHSGWMTRGPTDSHVWRDIAILRKKQCGSLRAGFRCHF